MNNPKSKVFIFLRSISGVIIGYLVLALSSMAFVMIAFVSPVIVVPSIILGMIMLPYTLLMSAAAGYFTAIISGQKRVTVLVITVGLMTLVTIGSIVADIAIEPLWYKIEYLLVMIPGTFLPTLLRRRRKKQRQLPGNFQES